ncbi:hypothetical protein UFOVP1_27 [uncultured Caudovirales phage]|uniref:Uncharacterized protein n=1 Tax=uncultured Caudovirales phage TaxID=2100421 RepID=A0A6J5KH95_9CAUD|nr:hypothetical protein UFOVP1_27 [uncultured Caudovirales phage]
MKLLRLLDKITLDKKGKYTCVEGEASGHHHAWMNSEDVEVFNAEVEDQDGTVRQTLLAIVARATDFSHYNINSDNNDLTMEHASLVCNPPCPGAVYEISQQQEVNFDEQIVKIVD